MAGFYFDTSTIVKRYDPQEVGSQWVASLFGHPQTDLYLFSQLVTVEVTSAFYRKWRRAEITQPELDNMLRIFREDTMRGYWLEPINDSIVRLAVDLIERHPLRAYDSIQLATAISINNDLKALDITLLFLSADDQLLQAARSEGLHTDNPTLH
jgi:uncharacterized protein